ncbi:MAG: hypothetical protein OXF29_01565 [Hyphomicrobiales bacterium]|nr:hypothetical protein [Hyphomicrobiales bacterium]
MIFAKLRKCAGNFIGPDDYRTTSKENLTIQAPDDFGDIFPIACRAVLNPRKKRSSKSLGNAGASFGLVCQQMPWVRTSARNSSFFAANPGTYAIASGKWAVSGDLKNREKPQNFANQAGFRAKNGGIPKLQ